MKDFPRWPWGNVTDRAIVTDEQIAQWRAACPELDAQHAEALADREAALKTLKDAASQLFDINSRERKYIAKLQLPYYHNKPSYALDALVSDIRHAREAKQEKAKKDAAELSRQGLAARAVLWLAQRGKQPVTDYDPQKAVDVANNLAFEEEVARRVAELRASGDLIEFDGQNCGDCGGWDGEERRCSCGNRRVSWSASYGHSFENPSVYGEAY